MPSLQDYDTRAIRKLVTEAFTEEQLRRFCQDHSAFAPVVSGFGSGSSLNEMIDVLISYCQEKLLFDELLSEISRDNRRAYARYQDDLLDRDATSSTFGIGLESERGTQWEEDLESATSTQPGTTKGRVVFQQRRLEPGTSVHDTKTRGGFYATEADASLQRVGSLVSLQEGNMPQAVFVVGTETAPGDRESQTEAAPGSDPQINRVRREVTRLRILNVDDLQS